jgi:RNase P protein component
MVPQHRHRRYTQRSIQIPIKLDKRATMRNLLKRFAREEFCEIFSSYKGMHMRLFIFVNKKTLASFKDTIATQKKTSIVNAWKTLCKKDFISFAERL